MAILATVMMLLPWDEPTPYPVIEGKSTYYAIRKMEEVAHNRGMNLDGYAGAVALNRAGDIGRAVWIEYNGIVYGGEKGYLDVDCSQEGEHYLARESKNLIIELSHQQAMEWGMKGPVKVKVYFVKPISDPKGAI